MNGNGGWGMYAMGQPGLVPPVPVFNPYLYLVNPFANTMYSPFANPFMMTGYGNVGVPGKGQVVTHLAYLASQLGQPDLAFYISGFPDAVANQQRPYQQVWPAVTELTSGSLNWLQQYQSDQTYAPQPEAPQQYSSESEEAEPETRSEPETSEPETPAESEKAEPEPLSEPEEKHSILKNLSNYLAGAVGLGAGGVASSYGASATAAYLLSNPYILAGAGLATLGYGIYKAVKSEKHGFGKVWDGIKAAGKLWLYAGAGALAGYGAAKYALPFIKSAAGSAVKSIISKPATTVLPGLGAVAGAYAGNKASEKSGVSRWITMPAGAVLGGLAGFGVGKYAVPLVKSAAGAAWKVVANNPLETASVSAGAAVGGGSGYLISRELGASKPVRLLSATAGAAIGGVTALLTYYLLMAGETLMKTLLPI